MNIQEVLVQIPKFSFEERLVLLEALTQSLREAKKGRVYTGVSASELRGVLKTDEPPPTDEEIKEDYINYLAEKYS